MKGHTPAPKRPEFGRLGARGCCSIGQEYDLKSRGSGRVRAGSSPAPGTKICGIGTSVKFFRFSAPPSASTHRGETFVLGKVVCRPSIRSLFPGESLVLVRLAIGALGHVL